jgi:Flp pilus assembly protein TadD
MDLKTASGLQAAGRLAEAEAAYRLVLAGQPANGQAMHLLGVVLGQLGRPAEALESLEKASRVLPESPELLGNLAAALGKLGRHAEAAGRRRRNRRR